MRRAMLFTGTTLCVHRGSQSANQIDLPQSVDAWRCSSSLPCTVFLACFDSLSLSLTLGKVEFLLQVELACLLGKYANYCFIGTDTTSCTARNIG